MDNIVDFPDSNVSASDRDRIKDEAAAWVVKLQGLTYRTDKPVPAEQAKALRAWLSQSDLHRTSFLTMLSAWDAMGMLEELADVLPLADAPSCQNEQRGHRHSGIGLLEGFRQAFITARDNAVALSSGALLSGTAILALSLVISLALYLPQSQTIYTTAIGEQASYTLDDGSVLTLNTNTRVEMDYSDEQRKIILHRGEANFDVAKNKARPFVVYAGSGMVWAVGTAFNVNYQNAWVDVVVSEGTVKVFSGLSDRKQVPLLSLDQGLLSAKPDKPSGVDKASQPLRNTLLTEGESAQYSDTIVSKEALEKESLEKKLAWQQGSLVFRGESLELAMAEISRYTDRRLVIVDESIRGRRVGGRFKTDNVDMLIRSLAKSLDIKVEKGEGNKLLFSAQ